MKLSELWHLYEADIPKFLIEEDVIHLKISCHLLSDRTRDIFFITVLYQS